MACPESFSGRPLCRQQRSLPSRHPLQGADEDRLTGQVTYQLLNGPSLQNQPRQPVRCREPINDMPQNCVVARRILPRNDIFLLESIRVPLPTSNLLTSYSH
jgi:hypothetical protein